ncbi:MAG TPA: malto-oligosyltrehalose synthase [Burkholderiales bacterium]|nr:malto-oligosyltrehalose synthase [Burkholderiales bacterium]
MSEIAESYVDVWGRSRTIDPQTLQSLSRALGPARPRRRAPSLEKDARCYEPPIFEAGGRAWGITVQLYGLRSERNWGIGDFADLRALVGIAAGLGAAAVGVSPLHASSGASPYSPSSRHALNVLYIDVESVPGYDECPPARKLVQSPAFQRKLKKLRDAPLVDHAGVASLKLPVLEILFERSRNARSKRGKRLEDFRRSSTRGVRAYALFEALREKFGGGWQRWPEAYRKPDSKAVKAFARRHAKRVDFHLWLQAIAREQLDAAQARARALGMPIGLYVDLALGADAGGAEVWGDQAAYALEASIGAPPDEFNPAGQDWGLPPYSPRALQASAYRPFVELLDSNMPEGGALRMDHVMALSRLWWIPRGNQPEAGGYVRYPFEELLAVLARESRRRRCMVVGEDLGTVPGELRSALSAANVLSYRPLFFEKDGKGGYLPPQDYPRNALTCVSTHDLPTWKGYFEANDIALRESLGLGGEPEKERAQREADKARLAEALAREGLEPTAACAHLFLALTPCKLLMVQPEDVFELGEQANLPGTIDQHPNWRRKLPVPIERWREDPRVAALARSLAPLRGTGKRVPRATYRLQLNKDFRFADAIALVPYLAGLGVSHVYASPFLKARPGSLHGYDVVDHNQVNPEIGTEAELDALLEALRRHGMGLVLDVVPNHMGVLQGDNAWWLDVLEKGRASRYARYFDIDWEPAKPELRGKVLLPILGSHYGEALEKGELKLLKTSGKGKGRGAGKWHLCYYDHRLPLNEASLKKVSLEKARKNALALHELLERQHYRLAYWRVASDEINYRRFFEIADLAALRVEDEEVFRATHAFVARLCARPGVDGLRIDHPDGLADPHTYFERLERLCGKPWIVVEKITADHETLPTGWAVHGTTGYRFANLLTGLFVDREAESRFDRIYQRFTGEREPFEEIARASRMLIMGTTLAADLNMLATRLERIAAGNRYTRDYTVGGLRRALAEVAAHFPVYRTYVTERGAAETDRRYIDWAVGRARRASRIADPGVFDFIRSVLLLDVHPKEERRAAMVQFTTRFQQFTAPVVAKGEEDTAFYRYHRLVAMNEVGNDPRNFGFSLKAFHAASEDRARHWPHTMLGTSTHDTKRSEDVRARLGVLSEMASSWRLMLRRWSLMNRSARSEVNGAPAPSPADEYLYYQSLLGIWPDRALDAQDIESLRVRLQAYMLKAVREAKRRTSWINPDTEYEEALQRFIAASLENPIFVKDVGDAVARIGRLGLLVGLSQALLKVASPGVPDYYQGSELFDFSLVDPDNRRPVDYGVRADYLKQRTRWSPDDLLRNLHDGRAKFHVIARGLELRREFQDLFYQPAYTPLYADGGREENVCAFMLASYRRRVVAVAPRLFAHLVEEGDLAPLGEKAWGEARLPVPPGTYEDVLTGEPHAADHTGIAVAELLSAFPVALLRSTPASSEAAPR